MRTPSWHSCSGAAIVEFAFLLPIGFALLMGLIDFSRAFSEQKRVTLIASTIADLVSQQPTTGNLSLSTLDSILNAGEAIMTPYPTAQLAVTVSEIQLTANGASCCQAKVVWSVTQGGALRPCNTPLAQVASSAPPAPDNMLAAMADPTMVSGSSSAQLIVADVSDSYQPIFGPMASYISGPIARTGYRAPRAFGNLQLSSSPASTAGDKVQTCPGF